MGTIFAAVEENFDDLKIYTFNDNLYVSDSENGMVEMFNLIGNKVNSFKTSGNAITSMNDLPTGIYLVNYTKGNTTRTYKVIK